MIEEKMAMSRYFSASIRRQRGFTLIELLIVIAILGILATLGFGSFTTSQQKARDARRKNDLTQIGRALEAFYNDKGAYPLSNSSDVIVCKTGGVTCDWGDAFEDDAGTPYMVELPVDPRSTNTYVYESSDGSYYRLYALLENAQDPDIGTYTTDCGADDCNYGISSSNTNP